MGLNRLMSAPYVRLLVFWMCLWRVACILHNASNICHKVQAKTVCKSNKSQKNIYNID